MFENYADYTQQGALASAHLLEDKDFPYYCWTLPFCTL